jgi:transposase
MDETPIKAGRKEKPPPERGEMKTAYFWPIYGDRDEIAFPLATTRGSAVVREA